MYLFVLHSIEINFGAKMENLDCCCQSFGYTTSKSIKSDQIHLLNRMLKHENREHYTHIL